MAPPRRVTTAAIAILGRPRREGNRRVTLWVLGPCGAGEAGGDTLECGGPRRFGRFSYRGEERNPKRRGPPHSKVPPPTTRAAPQPTRLEPGSRRGLHYPWAPSLG